MSKLNDFQWRAEELDKLKVSEYKYVNIQIDSDYQWGSGWTSEQEQRFINEVYPKLREAGYSINAPTMTGACNTLSVKGDEHTDIYMHPMNFTGYAKVEDIEKLEALLSSCKCIDNVNIIRKDDCYDLSDHNYRKLIAAHAKEIMACLDEKDSKYDVGFDFAKKHRIPRIGDKMGLSSFDVDFSAVEMVFETAKNLGYFEERSRLVTQNTAQINNVDAPVAVPLYKKDITTARNNGEVELYRQSLNYNKACAKDIDKAIHNYYTYNNLDARAAFNELSDKYDTERITHIVAAHIANHDYDERYHKDVVDWAKNKMSEFTPLFIDKSNDYRLTAHAVLIDGFAQKCIENDELEATNELFKGSCFYEEIIYGEDDKGIYVNFTGVFLDKVYNEFAYRTGLYEDCKIENYDTLLNDSDATLSLYMNVYESDAISVTLSLQSEMYGYKDYDVPLNKGEEKALISLAEEYASKENTSLAVLMAEAKSAYGNEINSHNFINDAEKMRDFPLMSKEDFLASYSYLTDAEYNNTLELYQEKYLDILNTMGYKLIQNENGEYSVYDVHYGEFLKAENGNTLILDNAGHLFNALYETFDENYLAELAFDYTDYGIGDDAPSNFMNWIDFASKCIDGNCTADEKALYEAHKNDLDAIFVMGGGYDKIDLDKVYALSEEKGAWKGIDPEYNEKLFIETLAAMKISLTNSENGINLYDNELNEHFDDDGEICCFSSAGDIFERLDSYISDYFIGYMSSEFRENNMSGEMPSSCEEWANYGIHCQYGTPHEQEFFKAHEKDIEMINLIANDFEEIDLQKAVEITEKSREDQKHTPNKKKNDYTDRE